MHRVKTLLLIAGRSRRFWPLREKTLFPVCGTNLLKITTGRLKDAGLTDIILVGGEHNLKAVRSLYPEFPTVEQKDLTLGMRGALLDALPQCRGDSVVVVCVNDVIDASAYSTLVKGASKPGVHGALLAQKVDRYFPGGYLKLEGDRITDIIEKPKEGSEPSDLVNIVAHAHNDSSSLLEALKKAPDTDDGYEQALGLLCKNHDYCAVPYEGIWNAVKYPWHLLPLLSLLLEGIQEQRIHPSADVHPSAVIDGPVILEEDVKIMPHATVRGPCYIGQRSIVANNALVRNSSIGTDCVVGYSSEVKSSIFASHVWTHSTYIGDSIIANNVSFGSGCATGNLRLDEEEIFSNVGDDRVNTGLKKFGTVVGDNCRIGIHASINPGRKIGSESFIGSHTLVSEDVPDRSFARMKGGELTMSENIKEVPRPDLREGYRRKIQ